METKELIRIVALIIGIATSTFSYGQQHPEHPGKDPMQESFFPPELVMRYQNDIQLKKDQKELIISTMEEAQKKFTRLQWDLQAEMEGFQKLLSEPIVNETNALAQLDKVLDQERVIKKAQVQLMIRIKNTLTGEQQAKLNSLKNQGGR
jgi:Spy/CpxP family protein refolding chaperone